MHCIISQKTKKMLSKNFVQKSKDKASKTYEIKSLVIELIRKGKTLQASFRIHSACPMWWYL